MLDTVSRSRRLIKSAVATALCRTRAQSALSSMLRRNAPLVLGYHRVVDDFSHHARQSMPAMLVSRTMLERHLDWIGRDHEFVSLDELAGRSIDGPRPRKLPAAVTFDDGYRDVYEQAFPMLVRKGIPAAVFVVTDLIGTTDLQLHDELYLLLARALETWPASAREVARRLAARVSIAPQKFGRMVRESGDAAAMTLSLLRAMSRDEVHDLIRTLRWEVDEPRDVAALQALDWSMVREMAQAGIVIGSHTRSHTLLTNERIERQSQETIESKRRLEAELGMPIRHFAYPDGSFNAAAVKAVAAAGYHHAYTTCAHRDPVHPSLTMPRCLLWEHSSVNASGRFAPDILACQTQGILSGSRACTPNSHL